MLLPRTADLYQSGKSGKRISTEDSILDPGKNLIYLLPVTGSHGFNGAAGLQKAIGGIEPVLRDSLIRKNIDGAFPNGGNPRFVPFEDAIVVEAEAAIEALTSGWLGRSKEPAESRPDSK